MAPDAGPPRRRRRLGRWCAFAVLALTLLHGCAVLARVPISWPFDAVINAGFAPSEPDLKAPADGKRRLCVLLHGLWRTSAALGRLERTLRAHGYEVANVDYASLAETIEQAAARLHDEVERRHARPVDELCFVGHSMGGLVIQEYLRRADARVPTRCVYLATPHRGAILADLRKHWFLFRLVMGDQAALQLSPGAPLHQRPIPWPERAGALVGTLGAGNASIPGDDDGTVGVAEAVLPGAAAVAVLPFGHTRMGMHPDVCRQVLHFLRRGAFAATGSER
ncbi:MAG: alpha/beta fold hydrolase [Planctomycetes bacterium]|nr:alpha/beta fold hydrolase [Planctomycetota bacterium]